MTATCSTMRSTQILSLETRSSRSIAAAIPTSSGCARERMMLDQKMVKKQDAQRKHLQAFVDRFRAKASKARQAQSRIKMLAKMEPIDGADQRRSAPDRLSAAGKTAVAADHRHRRRVGRLRARPSDPDRSFAAHRQ